MDPVPMAQTSNGAPLSPSLGYVYSGYDALWSTMARLCKDSGFMHLVQFLWFMEATFPFQMSASHIPGVNNTLARSSLPQ